MHAQVGKARDLVPEADHDQLLVEQRDRHGLVAKVRDPAHGLPAPAQRPMEPAFAGCVEMDVRAAGTQHSPIMTPAMVATRYGIRPTAALPSASTAVR
jgi:hypothetical protein